MLRPRRRQLPGSLGWAILAAYVLVWDAAPGTETLSHAYANSERRHKHGHPAGIFVWLLLTVHLLRILPDRLDPIRRLASRYPYKEH